MDKLWAPWRSEYLYLRKDKRCIFCGNRPKGKDRTRYIVKRSGHSFAMLNRYPYNNGHIMVAPFRHVKYMENLTAAELNDLFDLVNRMKMKIDTVLKPHGYNIGMNIGKVGGAGFEGHLHVHIVPRWNGDTNFMPVISGTKVISESLDAVYDLLLK